MFVIQELTLPSRNETAGKVENNRHLVNSSEKLIPWQQHNGTKESFIEWEKYRSVFFGGEVFRFYEAGSLVATVTKNGAHF